MSAKVENISPDRCRAEVALRGAAATYFGRAEGGCGNLDALRSAAQATAVALREIGHSLKVEGVELLQAWGEPAVVVRVTARHDEEARTLTGFCLSGEEPARAATLAVLNATNRFFDIA